MDPATMTLLGSTGFSMLGGLGSALISSKGAGKMAKAIKKGIELQKEMYHRGLGFMAPYRDVGEEFLGTLAEKVRAGPGEFEEDPGYQFRLAEGIKARERGAAAKGTQLSGAQLKGLERFGQDYASGEYQNFLNRYYQSLAPYAGMVDLGFSAAGTSAGLGERAGANLANLYSQLGQAQRLEYQPWAQFAGTMGQNLANALSIYGSGMAPTGPDPTRGLQGGSVGQYYTPGMGYARGRGYR